MRVLLLAVAFSSSMDFVPQPEEAPPAARRQRREPAKTPVARAEAARAAVLAPPGTTSAPASASVPAPILELVRQRESVVVLPSAAAETRRCVRAGCFETGNAALPEALDAALDGRESTDVTAFAGDVFATAPSTSP